MKKPTLAKTLQTRLARLEAAKSALAREAHRIQASCKHSACFETKLVFGEYFGDLMPLRICAHCRLEEEGTIHSGGALWSKKDHEPSAFKRSIVLGSIGRDEFYALRLPVAAKAPTTSSPTDEMTAAA